MPGPEPLAPYPYNAKGNDGFCYPKLKKPEDTSHTRSLSSSDVKEVVGNQSWSSWLLSWNKNVIFYGKFVPFSHDLMTLQRTEEKGVIFIRQLPPPEVSQKNPHTLIVENGDMLKPMTILIDYWAVLWKMGMVLKTSTPPLENSDKILSFWRRCNTP